MNKVQKLEMELWKNYLIGVKNGSVTNYNMGSYGQFIISRMLESRKDKEEAWDKLEECVDEVENHEVKDLMQKVMLAVTNQRKDDKLARNSGIKTKGTN
jgi:hypothetical protein